MPKRPPKPPDRESNPRTKKPRGEQKPSIATLIRALPFDSDFTQIDKDVDLVHDRAAAILLACELELYLELILLSKLPVRDEDSTKALLERDGPLSGFYSKILLAHALGIINEDAKHDLD